MASMKDIKVVPEISVGHIMTFIGLLTAAAAAYYGLKDDVTRVDFESRIRDKDLSSQMQRTADSVTALVRRVEHLEEDEHQ